MKTLILRELGRRIQGKLMEFIKTLGQKVKNESEPEIDLLKAVRTALNPDEKAVRTVGIKIKTVKDEDTKILQYEILQASMSCTLFTILCSGHGSLSFFPIVSSKLANKEPKTSEEVDEDQRRRALRREVQEHIRR